MPFRRRACRAFHGMGRSIGGVCNTANELECSTNARQGQVSSRRESHPPALVEPYVTVSCHTAPTGRPWVVMGSRCQWANSLGSRWRTALSQAHARAGLPRNRLNFRIAQPTRCSSMRFARKLSSELRYEAGSATTCEEGIHLGPVEPTPVDSAYRTGADDGPDRPAHDG